MGVHVCGPWLPCLDGDGTRKSSHRGPFEERTFSRAFLASSKMLFAAEAAKIDCQPKCTLRKDARRRKSTSHGLYDQCTASRVLGKLGYYMEGMHPDTLRVIPASSLRNLVKPEQKKIFTPPMSPPPCAAYTAKPQKPQCTKFRGTPSPPSASRPSFPKTPYADKKPRPGIWKSRNWENLDNRER